LYKGAFCIMGAEREWPSMYKQGIICYPCWRSLSIWKPSDVGTSRSSFSWHFLSTSLADRL